MKIHVLEILCTHNTIITRFRFNRLAWGYADGSRERGVLVAGMENGDLDIWDPSQIIVNAECVLASVSILVLGTP